MLNSKNARKQRFRHAGSKASAQAAIKKGIELPINTLVIIVVAVIVIIAIAAFFMGGFGGSTRDIQNKQTFLNTCSGWVQTGCNANDAISISDAKKAFLNWQPTKNDGSGSVITPSGVSEIDYLASMCGCFGASVDPRSRTGGGSGGGVPPPPGGGGGGGGGGGTPVCTYFKCDGINTVPCSCAGSVINAPNVWCGYSSSCSPGRGFENKDACIGACGA